MSAVTIIAASKNKKSSPFFDLWDQYAKRLQWKCNLIEIEAKSPKDELQKLKEKINPSLPLIALDEKGKPLSSIEFSKHIEKIQLDSTNGIQFIIGGADGLDDEIRDQAPYYELWATNMASYDGSCNVIRANIPRTANSCWSSVS